MAAPHKKIRPERYELTIFRDMEEREKIIHRNITVAITEAKRFCEIGEGRGHNIDVTVVGESFSFRYSSTKGDHYHLREPVPLTVRVTLDTKRFDYTEVDPTNLDERHPMLGPYRVIGNMSASEKFERVKFAVKMGRLVESYSLTNLPSNARYAGMCPATLRPYLEVTI